LAPAPELKLKISNSAFFPQYSKESCEFFFQLKDTGNRGARQRKFFVSDNPGKMQGAGIVRR